MGDNVPEQKIYPIAQALKMAQEMELDLVEIAPNAEPPVCKIIDYQKYLYQQKKKATRLIRGIGQLRFVVSNQDCILLSRKVLYSI